jgi:hypothetical protein
MAFEFDNVESAKEKINKISNLLEEALDLSNIQFPIEDDEKKQFNHLTLYQLIYEIKAAQVYCCEVKTKIEEFETKISKQSCEKN